MEPVSRLLQGLGRRRIENHSTRFHPNLLAWRMNKQPYPTASRDPPLSSLYKVDFRGTRTTPMQQTIVTRPKTSFDKEMPLTTSYRYAHGTDNPNKATLNAMSNQSFRGTQATSGRKLRVTSAPLYRESVASCMSWSTGRVNQDNALPVPKLVPHPPEAPKMVPHPPEAPKTANVTPTVTIQPPAVAVAVAE